MKVGFLYEYDFSAFNKQSGSRIYARQLMTHLKNLGIEVSTFSNDHIPSSRVYPFDRRAVDDFVNNIDVLYLTIDGNFLSNCKLYMECIKRASALSRAIVWNIHAPADEMLWFTDNVRRINRWWLQKKIAREESCRRKFARLVQGAVCVSEALRQYAVTQLNIRHCMVIPNGSDPSLFSPEKRNDTLYADYRDYFKVVYASSHYPWQGVDFVIRLAEMAKRRGNRILFLMLNNRDRRSNWECVKQNVFVRRVDYVQVPSYLASADLCLCLYKDFSHLRWGFYMSPLKLFDYMASAKPVIASRMGQIAHVIEDGRDGLLTNNDIGDIYRKILFCMENRGRADAMGQLAHRKILQRYNWKRITEMTIGFFNASRKQRKSKKCSKKDILPVGAC